MGTVTRAELAAYRNADLVVQHFNDELERVRTDRAYAENQIVAKKPQLLWSIYTLLLQPATLKVLKGKAFKQVYELALLDGGRLPSGITPAMYEEICKAMETIGVKPIIR